MLFACGSENCELYLKFVAFKDVSCLDVSVSHSLSLVLPAAPVLNAWLFANHIYKINTV